jgi:hypothetical protein
MMDMFQMLGQEFFEIMGQHFFQMLVRQEYEIQKLVVELAQS